MQAADDLALVKGFVPTLETFPPDSRQVFLDGLPGTVVGTGGMLLAAALQDAQQAAEKACEEATAAAEEAAKELDVVKAAVGEATAAVEAAEAEAEKTETASKALAKEVKEAEKEHKFAEKAAEAETKKWAAMREERARAASVLEGSFRLLEAGGWEDEEAKEASVQAVEEYLTELKSEQVLIAAVPSAIGLKPDLRKPFDKMAVEATGTVLSKHLESLDARVKAAEPEEKEVRAELLGLWAIAEVTGDKAREAKEKNLLANAEWATAESRHTLSKKRLLEVEATSTETSEKKARRESRLAELASGRAAIERLSAAPAAEAAAGAAEAGEAASSTA